LHVKSDQHWELQNTNMNNMNKEENLTNKHIKYNYKHAFASLLFFSNSI